MKRFTLYLIWTWVLTAVAIGLNIWGMLQKCTPENVDSQTNWLLITGIISAFALFRWLRVFLDDDIRD